MKKLVLAALALADAQRRHHRLQVAQVADLRPLDRLGAGHRDGDGGVLQRSLALGRGDEDGVARAGVLVGRVGVAVGGGGGRFVVVLGKGGTGQAQRG